MNKSKFVGAENLEWRPRIGKRCVRDARMTRLRPRGHRRCQLLSTEATGDLCPVVDVDDDKDDDDINKQVLCGREKLWLQE